jgi:flagellar biosynthesis/type III secretory pathway chaperone
MYSQPNSQVQELHSILLNEKQAFDELLLLLKQERAALEEHSVEDLASYSSQKQKITKNMEQLAISRNNSLNNAGFDINGSTALSDTVKQLPQTVQQLWKQILTLAEDCHNNNQVNGKIIQISKTRVDRSLRLLKSQTADPSLTYNAKGYAHLSSSAAKALEA